MGGGGGGGGWGGIHGRLDNDCKQGNWFGTGERCLVLIGSGAC